jgi:cobyrinic acid a,c-diamide synthase
VSADRDVRTAPPRLVIAGLGGDSGKTLVSLALVQAARTKALDVRAFKKGPDYIDPAWLGWVSGQPARNLDTYLMGAERVRQVFARAASGADLAVIEGNRGLYDGVDAAGTHSTAELAKALGAPVVLVVNATKTTRTVAAFVLGCQRMDPAVEIAGVVLNQVNGARHERVIRGAIESVCGVPVLGVLPRIPAVTLLPGRHMGLVPPAEHGELTALAGRLADLIVPRLDMAALLDLARRAPERAWPVESPEAGASDGRGLRIGFLRDSAFTFYYPENLEGLEAAGAELVPLSSLTPDPLPDDLHALYIGGGFPETHAAAIAANRPFLDDLRRRAEEGLPIYAECGGLMLLARHLRQGERVDPMAGVLPCDVELCARPQGHGYMEMVVDTPNPFFPAGTRMRGHEFHYSRLVRTGERLETACALRRGVGSIYARDGLVVHNVWATYAHVHATATPEWVPGLIRAARAQAGGPAGGAPGAWGGRGRRRRAASAARR